jgi:hypothetical protein
VRPGQHQLEGQEEVLLRVGQVLLLQGLKEKQLQKHMYYEGEFCEAEDLPNGFTKIRSVTLVKLTKLFISDNHPCFQRAFILIEMLT